MPSASMYGSPYVYKEPPKRIDYPPMCICWSKCTFKHLMDSKILALSGLVLGIAWLCVIAMSLMPFWFKLVLDSKDATFGGMSELQGLTINSGIFFLREDHFDNLMFLNKFSNIDVVPKVLAFAQLCSVFGNTIITCSLLATIILMLRRFASPTGSMMLAAGATVGAVFQILSCIFCVILVTQSSCEPGASCYVDNQVWRMVPMYSQMYRVEPHLTPMVEAGFALYIGIIGAVLCIVAAVMLWIEANSTTGTVSKIRYQQLSQYRDPHEDDINPQDGKKYVYAAPQHYGHGAFGMQPVIFDGHTYPRQQFAQPGPFIQPGPPPPQPSVGFGPGPVGFEPRGRYDDSETYSQSESSYYSGRVVTEKPGQREINL